MSIKLNHLIDFSENVYELTSAVIKLSDAISSGELSFSGNHDEKESVVTASFNAILSEDAEFVYSR